MKELKALEILKKKLLLISKSSEVHQEYVDAIAELEALQAPKTCDGCEYAGYSISEMCGTCSCKYDCTRMKMAKAKLYPDMYKTKAQQ